MKGLFRLPKTTRGWFSLILILLVVFIGGWPIIPLLNKDVIVFGMPLLMVWSILIIFLATFSMWLIEKIGGVD